VADLGSLLGAAGVGGVIGKAIVSLELSTAKYQAELRAAQGETAASTSAMGSGFSKFGSIAKTAMLGVGVAVVAGVAASVKAASDLNEQINKTKEVFEGNAATVLAWSKTTAESFGVSETAALTAAGSYGQIFDAAGLAESASSKMSMSLVELASDLASFNNIDPTEALDKLQAGLAGQARPLREVGVFLSAARVETEAYTSGIAEQGAELTDAQKIQARYNLILQDTTKAQGDFQRTLSESLPNQIRVVKAELEDAAATIGQSLIPVLLDLATTVADNTDKIAGLASGLEHFINVYSNIAQISFAPWTVLGDAVATAGGRVGELNLELPSVERHLEATQAKAALAAAGFHNFTSGAVDAKTGLNQLGQSAKLADVKFADLTLTLEENAKQTKITREEFLHATNVMDREARQLADALKEIAKEDWVNPKYVAFLSEQGPEWLIGFANLTETQQHRAQQAWKDSTAELDNARTSQDKMIGALDKLDKSTTKHTVQIKYEYVGFDPSKPGMAAGQTGGATSNQQR